MELKLISIDQACNSNIIEFVTQSPIFKASEDELISFIESEGLNTEIETKNYKPGNYDTAPEWETELIEIDAKKYLDNNFDDVTAKYFNQVILKETK